MTGAEWTWKIQRGFHPGLLGTGGQCVTQFNIDLPPWCLSRDMHGPLVTGNRAGKNIRLGDSTCGPEIQEKVGPIVPLINE